MRARGVIHSPSVCHPFPFHSFPCLLFHPFFPIDPLSSLPLSLSSLSLPPAHHSGVLPNPARDSRERCELPQRVQMEPGRKTVSAAFCIQNHYPLIALLALICSSLGSVCRLAGTSKSATGPDATC